ncbi:MAG: hypothetical protein ACRDTA_23415 [Pseudonocardiaceae bacterium]
MQVQGRPGTVIHAAILARAREWCGVDPPRSRGAGPRRSGPAQQPKGLEGLQGTDTAFAGIVAGLQPESDVPRWSAEEDHFEPPEPPPLPVPRPRTLGGLALLTVGVLLLLGPNLLGLGAGVATPLGLLALTAGIGWLVIGLRSGPPSEGWDDGARL